MLQVSPLLNIQSTKVLVVDERESNRSLIADILSSLTIQHICCLNTYQNFESHFLSFLPDLLILNCDLVSNAIEPIIDWVRDQEDHIPIIVSGENKNESINHVLSRGANDYIQTPFIATQIAVSINNVMQLSHTDCNTDTQEQLFDHRLQLSVKALQAEILQRSQVEKELHFQAHHEYHSRLPNRIFLQNFLDDVLTSHTKETCINSVLAIFHLHHFNEINNTLGHNRADEILVDMALRFSSLCQQHIEILPLQYGQYDQAGPVALLDRTHFTIVINNGDVQRQKEIIEQLLMCSSQPLHYQGMQIETPISVGFAAAVEGDDVMSWLRRAHVALEFAEQEKQPWASYSERADRYSKKKLTLVADLRNAIACDEGLFLHYQPQFDCGSAEISGAEVLLRWQHPIYGLLPADEIVSLAEQTGLIQPLTRWVISNAFAQHQQVMASGFEITLSINLSTLNLWQDNLLKDITEQLVLHKIPAHHLVLEVTETVLLKKPRRSLEFLRALAAQGMRIALDDFGTGFSSLAYLKKMPVSELKIDRSFVQELCSSREDQVIVETVLAMCKGLGVEVVAEGVENKATQLKLQQLGCDRLQGYFLSKPLSGEDFILRLEAQRSYQN